MRPHSRQDRAAAVDEQVTSTTSTVGANDVTFYLEFRDADLTEQFREFKEASISPRIVWVLAAVITFYFAAYWGIVLTINNSTTAIAFTITTIISVILPLWVTAFYRDVVIRRGGESSSWGGSPEQQRLLIVLESWCTLAVILVSVLVLTERSMNGQCPPGRVSMLESFVCLAGNGRLPAHTSFVRLFAPTVFMLGYASLPWRVTIVATIIAIGIVLYSAVAARATNSSIDLAITIAFILLVQYNVRLQQLQLFVFTTKYYRSRELRHQEREELRRKLTTAMRNMVGSVSHDMKTPLSAFLCGLDTVRQLTTVITTMFESRSGAVVMVAKDTLEQTTSMLHSTLDGISGACQMLLLNINRCTDFTKISHGLPLTPSIEAVQVQCIIREIAAGMRSEHGEHHLPLEIELDDEAVATPVMTDRQWLQDNILTLVDNGLKYSPSSCEPVVRVTIQRPCCAPLSSMRSSDEQVIVHPMPPSFQAQDGVRPPQTRQRQDTQSLRFADAVREESKSSDSDDDTSDVCLRVEVQNVLCEHLSGRSAVHEVEQSLNVLPDVVLHPLMEQRKVGGLGLGLYCLARRVAALHGRVGVKHHLGTEGGLSSLTVWFTIPYVPAADNEGNRSVQEESKARPSVASSADLHSIPPCEESKSWDSTCKEDNQSALSLQYSSSSSIEMKTLWAIAAPKEVPPADTQTQALPTPQELLNRPAIVGPHPKRKVLVVDDSNTVRKMLRMMLERAGFEVHTANNGREALDAVLPTLQMHRGLSQESMSAKARTDGSSETVEAAETKWDLVLMDLQMPVVDGLEAIRQIRSAETEQAIPNSKRQLIVAITANADQDVATAAHCAGADEFLAKPIRLENIQRLLNQDV